MPRVLLLATTTGYQTRAFSEAAERLGVDLVYATDRCHVLEDPWRDEALPIRFFDETGSVATILEASSENTIDGVLAVGDRPTAIAARVLEGLGLPGHPPEAAMAARNKLLSRQRLREAGLPVPFFRSVPISADPHALAATLTFPCVVKPLELSGSRGVMRADSEADLLAAFERLRALLQAPDIRAERSEAHGMALVEGFIEGQEFAVEGVMNDGTLHVLAVFDKPDPLDGPFFEETIYVTPTRAPRETAQAIVDGVTAATRALGLWHGPIHAECRVGRSSGSEAVEVFVLEVAARPIGGLCARALRFHKKGPYPFFGQLQRKRGTAPFGPDSISFEELLLRHALGEKSTRWERERVASGVMMMPIPARGMFRRVAGLDEACRVPGVDEVRITAKTDQVLLPLPEGASYLGFIFARASEPTGVIDALREAYRQLTFTIDPGVPVVQSRHG